MNSATHIITEDVNGNPWTDPRRHEQIRVDDMGEAAKAFFVPKNLEAFGSLAQTLQRQGVIEVLEDNQDGSMVVKLFPEKIDTNQAPLPIHQEILDGVDPDSARETIVKDDTSYDIPRFPHAMKDVVLGEETEEPFVISVPELTATDKQKERVRNIPLTVQQELQTKLAKKPEWLPVIMRMSRMGHQVPAWTRKVDGVEVGVFFEIPRPIDGAAVALRGEKGLVLLDPLDQLGADIMQAFNTLKSSSTGTGLGDDGTKDLLEHVRQAKAVWDVDLLSSFCEKSTALLSDLFRVGHQLQLSEEIVYTERVNEFLMDVLLDPEYVSVSSVSQGGTSAAVTDRDGTTITVDYLSKGFDEFDNGGERYP